ncbi:MAG: carboxypeptidase [Acidobacteria bacterium]|nr:carboxypeptidase [Acidobacteriota bacterium]
MTAPYRARIALALAVVVAAGTVAGTAYAQDTMMPELAARTFPVDTKTISEHEITVGGVTFPYTAEVGMQPVWDDEGKVVASLFYTYYQRTDVDDRSERPLMVSFNGGPGSASLWMHIGYTGPRKLRIDDEGFPVQPYGMDDNNETILDVADIVFVNPVNVGFSRIVGDADRTQFFGVNEDIAYLAEWIGTFVSRHDRWASPKYLIGESYGTTRVSGLAGALQGRQWMFLNGVILVSPTGLGIDRAGPVRAALSLPNYTATAWYHGQLEPSLQNRDLEEILPEVEEFTIEEYLPALAHGGHLPEARRNAIAESVARWAGVSTDWVLDHNLTPSVGEFRKELMRDEGLTVGRLDARYRGRDREDAGMGYDYDPAMAAWNHAFSPAVNIYFREELGWETDLQYYLFGPVRPWNRNGDNTGEQLRQAMASNPYLHVMVQAGYYDGGTDYFSSKYTLWNMDPSGRLLDRTWWKGYRSGHMMYLRAEDLITSNQDIRDFVNWSLEALEESAQH